MIFSRTAALTDKCASRPRAPGFQAGFGGAGVFLPLETGMVVAFTGLGEVDGGLIADTLAQVEGPTGLIEKLALVVLSTSFSERKIGLKFRIRRPVAVISRTVGGPSIIVMRSRSVAFTTSSRKGAYPAS